MLRRYPELRLYAAEYKIETNIFEAASLSFKKLEKPQEISFLEYIIHVIETTSYDVHSFLLKSFFEYTLPAFTIRCGGEPLSSHEYFAEKIAQSCLTALNIMAETVESREELHFEYLLYVYTAIIRDTFRNKCISSSFQCEFNNRILSELQSLSTKFAATKILPQQLFYLNRLLCFQARDQNVQAFAKLNPTLINTLFGKKKPELTKKQLAILNFFQYTDRNYQNLEVYSHEIENVTHREPLLPKQPQVIQEKTEKIRSDSIRFEEDPNKRAALARAVLEAKPLDLQHTAYLGSPSIVDKTKLVENWNGSVQKQFEETKNPFLLIVELIRTSNHAEYPKKLERSCLPQGFTDIRQDLGIQFKRKIDTQITRSVR